MSTILIIYGSTTGNTETAANMVADVLRDGGHTAVVLNAATIDPIGLCSGFNCVLLGSSTWGDGELQDDFYALADCFENFGLGGVNAAAFGCGDSGYPAFCKAVETLEGKLEELGAKIVTKGLKIDGSPADAEAEITAWATEIGKAL